MRITQLQIKTVPAIGGFNRLSCFWRDADTRQSFVANSMAFRGGISPQELAMVLRDMAKTVEKVGE